jgi:hypothetical protein
MLKNGKPRLSRRSELSQRSDQNEARSRERERERERGKMRREIESTQNGGRSDQN